MKMAMIKKLKGKHKHFKLGGVVFWQNYYPITNSDLRPKNYLRDFLNVDVESYARIKDFMYDYRYIPQGNEDVEEPSLVQRFRYDHKKIKGIVNRLIWYTRSQYKKKKSKETKEHDVELLLEKEELKKKLDEVKQDMTELKYQLEQITLSVSLLPRKFITKVNKLVQEQKHIKLDKEANIITSETENKELIITRAYKSSSCYNGLFLDILENLIEVGRIQRCHRCGIFFQVDFVRKLKKYCGLRCQEAHKKYLQRLRSNVPSTVPGG